MKKYTVFFEGYARIQCEVEAEDEEDAIEVANWNLSEITKFSSDYVTAVEEE